MRRSRAREKGELYFKGSGAFLRSKLLVDGNRMLQVLYVGRSEEQRSAAAVGEIFQSFQVTEAPAAEPAATGTPRSNFLDRRRDGVLFWFRRSPRSP